MSFTGAAALESARTNAEAAAATRVRFRTLRAALAHGLRACGLLNWAPRRCATAVRRPGREVAAARAIDRVWATPV